MTYKIDRLWHTSFKATDLAACEKFFKDVFGRDSVPVEECLPPKEEAPNYPRDYAILTMIQEVLFESVDPQKLIVDGRCTYEPVASPHLYGVALAGEGVEEIYKVCIENGIRSTDQGNRIASASKAPVTAFSDHVCFFTLPESAGLRYQIYPLEATCHPDPRATPGWKLPAVSDSDPLDIEFCSHHTIVTADAVKALNFLVGILHGKVIHTSRNALLETDSHYISLGDGVYEVAVPTKNGSFAAEDLKFNKPFDTYHSLTWKVRSLDKVAKHLASKNIRILLRDQHTIITNPEDTIGVPWGFTDKLIPGDHRLPG
jgi:hypothetical protein